MKKRHCICLGVLLAWCHAYWGQCFSVLGVTPDLSLIYIIIVSLFWGEEYGLLTGLSIGLLQDFMFSSFIGQYAFIYILIGYVTGMIRHNFFHENAEVAIILTAVYSFFMQIYLLLIKMLYGLHYSNISIIFTGLKILYNSIACIVMYYFLKKIKMRVENVRE